MTSPSSDSLTRSLAFRASIPRPARRVLPVADADGSSRREAEEIGGVDEEGAGAFPLARNFQAKVARWSMIGQVNHLTGPVK